jgi:hypothetical protein
MRVAVLFSPGAGNAERFRELGEALSRLLDGHEAYACPGRFGAEYLRSYALCDIDTAGPYVETIGAAVAALVAGDPELMVCVGGDGLASYAAGALIGSGRAGIPILGVAAGTSNVGPFVSLGAEDLGRIRLDDLTRVSVGAIEASIGQRHAAYGFNDVVIANTFLGTVAGRPASLSAVAMASRGERKMELPDPRIATESFAVLKNGAKVLRGLLRPAQIIASPLGDREFYGRAVAGALCESAYSDNKAALSLLGTILVRPEGIERGLSDFSRVDQLLFGPGDEVILRGLSESGQVIVDGNPYIRGGEDVVLEYRPAIAVAARARRSGEDRDVR